MPKKILIVDDDPTNLALVRFLLKSNEYEPVVAADGEEGLEKFKVERPDLIVLDIEMPKKDGYTFLTELKRIQTKSIPVIMLTSKEQFQDIFKMEGVSDYIVKPLDAEKFLKKIKDLLSGS